MIGCSKECLENPICDFCKYYNFNAGKGGVYTGNGFCKKHNKTMEPDDTCDDFHCSVARF